MALHTMAGNAPEDVAATPSSIFDHDLHDQEVPIPCDEADATDAKLGKVHFTWSKLWAYTGPGWLMSIAYLDPGNIESDLQSGIYGSYSLGWVLFWATALGLLLQILAARCGVVTGKQLAAICKEEYPLAARFWLWICTEIAIIGSDIQEVVGSAIALNILFGWELWIGVLVTGCDTFTFLLLEKFGIRKLEALFAALILTMAVSFFIVFGYAGVSWSGFWLGLVVPTVQSRAIVQAVGMVGAVIMPHNIYLHSALVQSRAVDRKDRHAVDEAVYYFSIEAGISLFVSFLINQAVLAVFAQAFYSPNDNAVCNLGGGNTMPCLNVGLHEAGDVLVTSFGRNAQIVWAIGLLAAGQSSTMTGTYAGQFVMSGFWNLDIAMWKRTLITRSIAIVPAVIFAVTARSELDNMDEWLNVLQSVQLPFAILPVLKVTSSAAIMGPYRNNKCMLYTTWGLGVAIVFINFYLAVDFVQTTLDSSVSTIVGVSLFGLCYLALVAYLTWKPIGALPRDHRASLLHDTRPWWVIEEDRLALESKVDAESA